jgi:hypothetical protein
MAPTAGYVPKVSTDQPVMIEFWGDTDVTPYLYLGWMAE